MSPAALAAAAALIVALAACALALVAFRRTSLLAHAVSRIHRVYTSAEEACFSDAAETRERGRRALQELAREITSSKNPFLNNAAVAQLVDHKAELASIAAYELKDMSEDESDTYYTPINVAMRSITRPAAAGIISLTLPPATAETRRRTARRPA